MTLFLCIFPPCYVFPIHVLCLKEAVNRHDIYLKVHEICRTAAPEVVLQNRHLLYESIIFLPVRPNRHESILPMQISLFQTTAQMLEAPIADCSVCGNRSNSEYIELSWPHPTVCLPKTASTEGISTTQE